MEIIGLNLAHEQAFVSRSLLRHEQILDNPVLHVEAPGETDFPRLLIEMDFADLKNAGADLTHHGRDRRSIAILGMQSAAQKRPPEEKGVMKFQQRHWVKVIVLSPLAMPIFDRWTAYSE